MILIHLVILEYMKKIVNLFITLSFVAGLISCSKIDSASLIGTWLSETETTTERTVKYTFDGSTMTITIADNNGTPFKDVYNYSLSKDKISIWQTIIGGSSEKSVLSITKLTETSMCWVNESGKEIHFKRIQ